MLRTSQPLYNLFHAHRPGIIQQAQECPRRNVQQDAYRAGIATGLLEIVLAGEQVIERLLVPDIVRLEFHNRPAPAAQVERVDDAALRLAVDRQAVGHFVQPALGGIHVGEEGAGLEAA